jgi:histidinol phosphatase-like PHP family hydrolase
MKDKTAENVASIAKRIALNPRKKTTKKAIALAAIDEQKANFNTALKNGYTRKEIVAMLREDGIKITVSEFSGIIGKRKKATASASA